VPLLGRVAPKPDACRHPVAAQKQTQVAASRHRQRVGYRALNPRPDVGEVRVHQWHRSKRQPLAVYAIIGVAGQSYHQPEFDRKELELDGARFVL
jgi:hypothetical protein